MSFECSEMYASLMVPPFGECKECFLCFSLVKGVVGQSSETQVCANYIIQLRPASFIMTL